MLELRAEDRQFQVWEYQVSHGQLLIRSPKSPATERTPERTTNVDIAFLGVEYMSVPRVLRGLVLEQATPEEVRELGALLGKPPERGAVVVLASAGRRFFVVAHSFAVSENDWDIFESPVEFRSRFRHGPP
jgi:hypothetical protein